VRHFISPCSPASHEPSFEKAIFRREPTDLRGAVCGVPICQIGRPLDFLADSEESRSSRVIWKKELVEPSSGLPGPAVPLPDHGLLDQVVSSGEKVFLLTSMSGNEGRGAMSGAGVENRCYTRFTLNAPATIWRESVTIAGQVVNISLGGAFLRMEPSLPLHEAVTLSVHDCVKQMGLLNDLPATVVRTTETGCAVRFERMLLERGIGDAMNESFYGVR
jgi:hypothetical protein